MRGQSPPTGLAGLLAAALVSLTGGCVKTGWTVETPAVPYVLPTEPCGHYFVAEARVNGAGPFRLLLDSGAPTTLLAPDAARTAGARGSVRVIAFGALTLRGRIPIRVRAMRHLRLALGTHIDGIAGFSLLDDLAVTFDFPAGEVRVDRTPPLRGAPGVVPMAGGDRPFVRARIGGREFHLLVDTGFSGGLALRRLTRFPLVSAPVPIGASVRIGGLRRRHAARLAADVETGAFVLARPVAQQAAGASLLGQAFMRDLAVTFASSRRLIRFAGADGRAPGTMSSPPARGTGLVLRPDDRHLDVLAVLPGTPAVKAGVRAGDEVVAVDGVPVADLGCGLRSLSDGRALQLRLSRDGRQFDAALTPGVLIR